MIEAANTVEVLTTVYSATPPNERIARELAPIAKEDPETARRVWGGLTARHVKKAVLRQSTKRRVATSGLQYGFNKHRLLLEGDN